MSSTTAAAAQEHPIVIFGKDPGQFETRLQNWLETGHTIVRQSFQVNDLGLYLLIFYTEKIEEQTQEGAA